MILWSGPLLPLFALIWPMLLGLALILPALRDHALRVLPLAPLPALVLALAGQTGETVAPELLLEVRLVLDESTRLLLGMTAAVWLAAGVFAQSMSGGRNLPLFAGFWCLTLTGNLGVFLAADVITFYVAFAAVSLAAWALVIHDRKTESLRAGRLYIVLAVVGEVCLLMGFLIGVQAADSFLIADIRTGLGEAPAGAVAVALLIVGFGIKAGMVPLHIWLPLAHPAAPVAASAVLSGAIVKAGLVGFWLFLPPGAFSAGLIVLGLMGAFGAALRGLTKTNPKMVLAYSTISQMGVMLALIGGGAASQVVALYAVHHGLAKGALFLAVGAMTGSSGRARMLLLVAAGVVALSVAGLPLTGGGAVKAAAKSVLAEGMALAVTVSGVTTTLILGWFLWRLAQVSAGATQEAAIQRLPVGALALAAILGPWLIWPHEIDSARVYALSRSAVFDGLWPLVLGLGLAGVFALIIRLTPVRVSVRGAATPFTFPDIRSLSGWRLNDAAIHRHLLSAVVARDRFFAVITAFEQVIARWRWSGLGVAMVLLTLALTMR